MVAGTADHGMVDGRAPPSGRLALGRRQAILRRGCAATDWNKFLDGGFIYSAFARRSALRGLENRHGIADAPMPDDGSELFDRHSHRYRQLETDSRHADHRAVSLLRARAHLGAW